jgi:hypothetical protein
MRAEAVWSMPWWARLVENEPTMFAHWAWITGKGVELAGR